jgi:hypothetical protein
MATFSILHVAGFSITTSRAVAMAAYTANGFDALSRKALSLTDLDSSHEE